MFQMLIRVARDIALFSMILIGVRLVPEESCACAQVLRWEIEATVIDIDDPDMIFTNVRGRPRAGLFELRACDAAQWNWRR
jgi:hypothetical protein